MILLRKKQSDGSYFNFDKILAKGYKIQEQPNEIAKKQLANGRRKKIQTAYIDCIITIDLGCFDVETTSTYLKQLKNGGEFEYYSIEDKKMKKAKFITTLPEQTIENASANVIISDFSVVIEKSGDIV